MATTTTSSDSAAAAPDATITTKAVVPDAVAVAAPAPIEVTLEEFCSDLSRDKATSVELIAGFHHVELIAGKVKQTVEAFQADFKAFAGASPARPARPARIAPSAAARFARR